MGAVSVGVDIGGTFTDVVGVDHDGGIRLVKVPSTPSDPSVAVRQALSHIETQWGVPMDAITRFVHGTTVATNAVLERKGARVGLLTTAGFRDVLEIGRSFRRNIYDLAVQPSAPAFLVPRHLRKEVLERMSATGEVITPLDHASLEAAVAALLAQGVDAIAISFLFSFVDATHEREAAHAVRAMAPAMPVSLSSEVDPSFREYERTCITAFDAYIKPVLERYLARMEGDLARAHVAAPLQVMQSRGGLMASSVARQRPVRLFLSGPAAGVIGAQAAANAVGHRNLITCDIGGTSCDIALIQQGLPVIRPEGIIDGYAVRVPMVDVNAIGAGGGSIAWIDGAGGLRVGPHSAGADPGPACYGRGGEEATVTDASLVLGYINPEYFAGGSMPLQAALAAKVIENKVARPLGLSVREAALGIHRVLNAQMAEGIRHVSVRRGCDPRGFALVALGGGGPLHATALATELGIESIIVPRFPGVLSAWGLLCAPVEHEVSSAFHRPLADTTIEDVRAVLARLDGRCSELMTAEQVTTAGYTIAHSADVCYVGQSHFVEVALDATKDDGLDALYRDFRAAHDRLYGHGDALPARIVNLRSIARTPAVDAMGASAHASAGADAGKGTRPVSLAGCDAPVTAGIFERSALPVAAEIAGPAVIEQADTTTLIEPGWLARVLPDGTLLVEQHRLN